MGNEICCDPSIEPEFHRGVPKEDQYTRIEKWSNEDEFLQTWLKKSQRKIPKDKKLYKHVEDNKYYYGEWKNGAAHGESIFYDGEKILFCGNFEFGKSNGYCFVRFISKNSEYEGNIINFKASGEGKYKNMQQNYTFNGDWAESYPKYGTLTLENDSNISHIQFDDYLNGIGTIYYKDQRRYKGTIQTTKLLPHGEGTIIFPNSNKKMEYKGQWTEGQMHGKGRLEWRDFSVYEGDYSKGQKDGYGKYFEGFWIDGKQDGAGILYEKDGKQKKRGIWLKGVFEKQLTMEEWSEQRIFDDQRSKNRKSASDGYFDTQTPKLSEISKLESGRKQSAKRVDEKKEETIIKQQTEKEWMDSKEEQIEEKKCEQKNNDGYQLAYRQNEREQKNQQSKEEKKEQQHKDQKEQEIQQKKKKKQELRQSENSNNWKHQESKIVE